MPDAEWIENLARIARQSVNAEGPCDVINGTVVGTSPLQVQIDQKLTLTGQQLICPQSLTDHNLFMSIPELGEVSVTIKNGLKQGEGVLLLQKRGGQQYVILDRR